MTILVIPDIHTRFDIAESIIKKENPDNIVFLGDYFDSYDDNLEIIQQTGLWLKKSLKRKNRLHLLGNHDLAYLDQNFLCSGFEEAKLWAIRNSKVDLTKLEHYCWVGDWLCTHAGLSYEFYQAYAQSGQNVNDFLETYSKDSELRPRLYDCSSSRGGRNAYSGIVWCDYGEFKDIPDLKQIFGHTKGDLRQTENHICIDTGLRNYAIYNGEMKVKENLDGISKTD